MLQADTGAGKSTVVPLALLKAPFLANKRIIMLEPRRMAARNLAQFMAESLGEKVGQTVGYQVKGERNISALTRLEVITEGILINRIQSHPELEGVGLIIFDEFHERSINTDLSLMLAFEIQQYLRDDLRLLVMSATLDTSLLAAYLNNAPVIFCSGQAFPVSVKYQETNKQALAVSVSQAVLTILEDGHDDSVINEHDNYQLNTLSSGHILVFLPGVADISHCISELKSSLANIHQCEEHIELLPLHGSLPIEQQVKAISASSSYNRKIIFSTNIAETSLTIQGVTCVIDSGLEKKLLFNPSSGLSTLTTMKISKASAQQRKGRAGRLMPGRCIRLWSELSHIGLDEFQQEEIRHADLATMLLELARNEHTQYSKINWLTAPPEAHFNSTQVLLASLSLVDQHGRISELGKRACSLPTHPRLAKMILASTNIQQRALACVIAALLSEKNIMTTRDSADLANSVSMLIDNMGSSASGYSKKGYQHAQVQHVLKEYHRLRIFVGVGSVNFYDLNRADSIAILLLHAFPERLAKRRPNSSNKYLLANGKEVFLHESDPLINSEFLVVNDCDVRMKEGRIFSAVALDENVLYGHFNQQITTHNDYVLAEDKQRIHASKLTKYGAITLAESRGNNIPPEFVIESIKGVLKYDARAILPWTEECERWLKRVLWLSGKVSHFPVLTESRIFSSADQWLLSYVGKLDNISALKRVNVLPLLQSILSYEEAKVLEQEAPRTYLTPSGKEVPIQYVNDQPPTVSVVLQELFGELNSPMIAANTIALRFELLSPARRSIQITSDLSGFWLGSYVHVAKDMRAKYPKHRWPEEPLKEKAGRSIKPFKKDK